MTPQTPPTDRPLTAGDVPLLREGDVRPCPFCGTGIRIAYDDKREMYGPEGAHLPGCIIGNWDLLEYAYRPDALSAWNSRSMLASEPVSNHYKFDTEVAWLREAARYFSARDTKGEDRAHWANVYNAENATKLADRLHELSKITCQLPALASPPVSERERKLEGALRMAANRMDRLALEVQFDTRLRAEAADWVAEARALTAQPAGEGK